MCWLQIIAEVEEDRGDRLIIWGMNGEHYDKETHKNFLWICEKCIKVSGLRDFLHFFLYRDKNEGQEVDDDDVDADSEQTTSSIEKRNKQTNESKQK